jgi:hypothetical protein
MRQVLDDKVIGCTIKQINFQTVDFLKYEKPEGKKENLVKIGSGCW